MILYSSLRSCARNSWPLRQSPSETVEVGANRIRAKRDKVTLVMAWSRASAGCAADSRRPISGSPSLYRCSFKTTSIIYLSIYLAINQSTKLIKLIIQSRIFNEYSIFFHRNAFQQRHLTLINHAFNSCLAQKTCLNMASIGLPYAAATKLDFIWSISCKFL